MTPIEKVARALHNNDPTYRWPWEEYDGKYHARRRKEARTAIEALREPSEAMTAAGEAAFVETCAAIDQKLVPGIFGVRCKCEGCDTRNHHIFAKTHSAMIDALLGEKPDG